MSNPLRWFRKYQNIMMWVFGVLMIIAFVFLGGMGSGVDMSDSVQGGGGGRGGGEVVATWNNGALNEGDFQSLREGRNRLIQFQGVCMNEAQQRIYADGQGSLDRVARIPNYNSDGSLLELAVLAQRAEEMGVDVDDEGILNYLTELTDNKLDPRDFHDIWANVTGGQSSDKQLFELLRREVMAIQYRGMIQSGSFPHSPIRHWDYYNRMEQKVSAEAVKLTADAFLDEVPDPSDSELSAYFDEYKDAYSQEFSPTPGFRQRPQVAFQTVKLDFNEFFEGELAAVTEEEIQKYYDENKSDFLKPAFLEDDLGLGGVPDAPKDLNTTAPPAAPTEEGAEEGATEEGAAEEGTTEAATTVPAETTEVPVETETTTEVPAENGTTTEVPVETETTTEVPAETSTETEIPVETGTVEEIVPEVVPAEEVPAVPAGTEGSSIRKTSDRLLAQADDVAEAIAQVDEAAGEVITEQVTDAVEGAVEEAAIEIAPTTENTGETVATETVTETTGDTAAPAEETTTETETAEATETTEATTETESDGETGEATTVDLTADAGEAKETVEPKDKYKPLEDVVDEIKRAIANPRAQTKMDTALATVRARCDTHYRQQVKYQMEINKGQDATKPKLPNFDDIESPTPIKIEEIPLCDQLGIKEYRIGNVTEMFVGETGVQRVTFAQLGFDDSLPLHKPNQFPNPSRGGFTPDQEKFVYWKTESREAYIPEFSEVRKDVLIAWKKKEAFAKATQAAEAFAKTAQSDAGKSLADICGDKGEAFAIEDIAWKSGGNIPFDTNTMPTNNDIKGVNVPGSDFYARLFSLGSGEVGVTKNLPEDTAYLLKVTSQSPELDVRRAGFFANADKLRGITYIAQEEVRSNLYSSFQEILKEEGVEWKRTPEANQRF